LKKISNDKSRQTGVPRWWCQGSEVVRKEEEERRADDDKADAVK
jgi:hypothetical protein